MKNKNFQQTSAKVDYNASTVDVMHLNAVLNSFSKTKVKVLTKKELVEQAVSFIYGNLHIENPNITRDGVRRAVIDGLSKK